MKKIIFYCTFVCLYVMAYKIALGNQKPFRLFMIEYSVDSTAGDPSSLNFWKGKWKATWEENGKKDAFGTNTITLEMNGKVIQEAFSIHAGESKGFRGHSVSVFDVKSGRWKQTWVDTDGGYLDFTGYKKGDDFYFEREYTGDKGKQVKQRMRFYHITQNSFTWDWEQSVDRGPWQLTWRIWYERVL